MLGTCTPFGVNTSGHSSDVGRGGSSNIVIADILEAVANGMTLGVDEAFGFPVAERQGYGEAAQ